MSGSDDFTLFLWNPVENKKPLARLTGHQQPVNHLAFSPDGRRFASASFDKKVKVWDGRTGAFLATLNGHVGAVYQVRDVLILARSYPSATRVKSAARNSVFQLVRLARCSKFRLAFQVLKALRRSVRLSVLSWRYVTVAWLLQVQYPVHAVYHSWSPLMPMLFHHALCEAGV